MFLKKKPPSPPACPPFFNTPLAENPSPCHNDEDSSADDSGVLPARGQSLSIDLPSCRDFPYTYWPSGLAQVR
jgi:hypothetical protein